MSTGTMFKQACPSCEALIPIRDPKLIGKKVECPKCKDRFIVQKPAEPESDTPQVKAKPEDAETPTELTPEQQAEQARKKKLIIGLSLGGIGILVLGVALWFMFGSSKPPTRPTFGKKPFQPIVNAKPDPTNQNEEKTKPPFEKKGFEKKGFEKSNDKKGTPVEISPPTPTRESSDLDIAKLTNLLPNTTEHVLHLFKDAFASGSVLDETGYGILGAGEETTFLKKLGFSLRDLDDLIRAEYYGNSDYTPWKYSVLHFVQPLDEAALVQALNLKSVPEKNGIPYYVMSAPNPWFDNLARLSVAVPSSALRYSTRTDRPCYVRLHDERTLILADETPMQDYLAVKGEFPRSVEKKTPSPNTPPTPRPAALDLVKIFENSIWNGTETGGSGASLKLDFKGKQVTVTSSAFGSMKGNFTFNNKDGELKLSLSGDVTYSGTVTDASITGTASDGLSKWNWQVTCDLPENKNPTTEDKKPLIAEKVVDPSEIRKEMYLTILTKLKETLDRNETRYLESKTTKLLMSSATMMRAAARVPNALVTEGSDMVPRRPREFWDSTLLLKERLPRIYSLGSVLFKKAPRTFQYRDEIICQKDEDAKEFEKDMIDRGAPIVARMIDRVLGHKVDLPTLGGPVAIAPPPAPTPFPPSKDLKEVKDDITHSQMIVKSHQNVLDFRLDLVLDLDARIKFQTLTILFASALRGEMDLASGNFTRHDLSQAGLALAKTGLKDRDVPPGRYPPGAFSLPESVTRLTREPSHRISWMSGLLPFLGQENLYNKIDFNNSWREPSNWMAGRSLVPQFLDPMYPANTRTATAAGVGVEMAATHYVGIAGVGRDAASYLPGDPAYVTKRGILGYDQSLSFDEIQKGRGAANSVLLIQVPHDGLTGVSPWIAGGGATLRGVPEKNSIAPFVLSKDRENKPIQFEGRRGTYATMADGSVRFIDQNVSDDVFKAMCSVNGPKFDLNKNTTLVPPPERKIDNPEENETKRVPEPAKKDEKKESKTPLKKDDTPKKTTWLIPRRVEGVSPPILSANAESRIRRLTPPARLELPELA